MRSRFNKMFLPAVTNRQTQIGLLMDMKNLIYDRFGNCIFPHSFPLTCAEQIQLLEVSI